MTSIFSITQIAIARSLVDESRSETRTSGFGSIEGKSASRVEKRGKKGKQESRTRKILLLKMLQSIVARWSHPWRTAVAFREVYLHFAKQNACHVHFSLSRQLHAFLVRSAFRCQRAERLNKKKGHSFRPFWRRWDANTTVSFSLVLFSSSTVSTLSLFAWLWISAADN